MQSARRVDERFAKRTLAPSDALRTAPMAPPHYGMAVA